MFGFSKTEVRDIAISTAVLAFAIGGFSGFLIALFVVGIAFIAHEVLGHKILAQHFGCFAEYRMWPMGLMLALLSSLTGIIFAAPGAVYISPIVRKRFAFRVVRLSKRQVGLIGLGGPFVNIALGLAFIPLISMPFYGDLFYLAAKISLFFGVFNLLPIHPVDGAKVFEWNKFVWFASFATAAAGYLFLRTI